MSNPTGDALVANAKAEHDAHIQRILTSIRDQKRRFHTIILSHGEIEALLAEAGLELKP